MRRVPRTTRREKKLPSCYEKGSENNSKRKKLTSCHEKGSENNSKRNKVDELLWEVQLIYLDEFINEKAGSWAFQFFRGSQCHWQKSTRHYQLQ